MRKNVHVRIQVKLSWDERVVPEGQLETQVPLLRKNPGTHAVHCFRSTTEAPLKPGIWHSVHVEPQAKHGILVIIYRKEVSGELTVAFAFRVVSNKVGTLADAHSVD